MKQVLQSLKTGDTDVVEVPRPLVGAGEVLVETDYSLISAGTERMLVDFGKAGWLSKARQQPDKVRQVVDKVRTDGLMPTVETVLNKLDEPLAMGYSNVGQVLEVGPGVDGFSIGQRVVSNGKHAEIVAVPQNLCAPIPDSVSTESAVFTVLGSIGLQGIRLVAPTLGECVAVTGLGLIGLLTVQLLRAHGCRVLGIDFDRDKLALARQYGASVVDLSAGEDPVAAGMRFSRGRGMDAVLITASTRSNEPVHQAAEMSRKRGRIVLVGVTGLELSRADFYEKELSFQVSCSYGPGRYDPQYEEHGNDYPHGFVRWTEQRNFEAVLDMLEAGTVTVDDLISHRYKVADAAAAYDLISGDEPSLGVLLEYSSSDAQKHARTVQVAPQPSTPVQTTALGFIGAGSYASQVLIPAFSATGVPLTAIASASGVSATRMAAKHNITIATSDIDALLSGESTAVVITTRHDTHADYVCRALTAGKHVFVEKPLVLNSSELAQVEKTYRESAAPRVLMVGFNRRFAPHVVTLKRLLEARAQPASFVMTINAGSIPPEHWTQDPRTGGGRIIGEACHFIDLLRFLSGSAIASVNATGMTSESKAPVDTVSINLTFADGSIGTVHYFANGNKGLSKERLEVFCGGGIVQLDNFRTMTGLGWSGFRSERAARQDKGNRACAAAFVEALGTGVAPIPFDELIEVHRATLSVVDAVR